MNTHTHIHTHTHTHTYIHTYMHMHTYVYIHTYIYTEQKLAELENRYNLMNSESKALKPIKDTYTYFETSLINAQTDLKGAKISLPKLHQALKKAQPKNNANSNNDANNNNANNNNNNSDNDNNTNNTNKNDADTVYNPISDKTNVTVPVLVECLIILLNRY